MGPLGRWLSDWFGVTLMFRWTGAAMAAAIMALPLMVRAMRLSLEGIDRRLEGAARTLGAGRSAEEHTSEPQSLMRSTYAVFCLKKKTIRFDTTYTVQASLI